MASISQILGQNSGIESLIQQYMALERRPIQTLETKKTSLNSQTSVFNEVKSKLLALEETADTLADTTNATIFNQVQVTSDDTDVMTVTAGTGAAQGRYEFRIRQLATATSMKSTADLNSHASTYSSSQVVSGLEELDTDEAWADAGFDNTPDGTVTINGVTFTLADYTTVDDFIDAVNEHATANALIYYDGTRDKFFIESTDGSDLTLSETGTVGFLTEVNITTGTHSTNQSGLHAEDLLYLVNFDTGLSESDSGSFKINGTTIEWDADTDTLNSIISDINHSDAGVTAFYDDTLDRIVFTSDTMGSEEIEWEDVSGTFLSDTLKLSGVTQSTGQNALFTINSTDVADEITKSSNTFTINGLIFTLKQTTVENDSYSDASTTAVTATSEKDESALTTAINSFLTNYNSVVDYIKSKTTVNVLTYTRGALAGESVFRDLRTSIMGVMLDQVSGIDSGKPSYLADIGITLDENLNASISDSTALSDWLEDDPDAVADLFNSTYGVATRMVALVEPYTESYGIIDDRKEAIGDKIELLDRRIDRLEDRLAIKEDYYRKQFTALQDSLNMITYQQSILQSLTDAMTNALGIA